MGNTIWKQIAPQNRKSDKKEKKEKKKETNYATIKFDLMGNKCNKGILL